MGEIGCPDCDGRFGYKKIGLRHAPLHLHNCAIVLYIECVGIEPKADCAAETHPSQRLQLPVGEPSIARTARIFRALGEPARIRLVARLAQGEACVTELAALEGESLTVISQRLRVLRADNIVGHRRKGKHLLYYLSDQHVLDLVFNALAHASEQYSDKSSQFAPDGALERTSTNVKSAPNS